MHSFISIMGMVLTGKENYQEWYRKVKRTLIFNDLWNGICEATTYSKEDSKSTVTEAQPKTNKLTIPTSNKERAI
jgi:hypothetical protein